MSVVVLFEQLQGTLWLFSLRDGTSHWKWGFGVLVGRGGIGICPRAALHGGGHEPGADLSDPRAALVGRRRRERRGGEIRVVLLHDLNLHHGKPQMDENGDLGEGTVVGVKEMRRSFE